MSEHIELETRVAVMDGDLKRLAVVFNKMDLTIEKLSDVSNSIAKLLAVHEEKLSKNEEYTMELFSLIEQRKQEGIVDFRELNIKLSNIIVELKTQMKETSKDLGDQIQVVVKAEKDATKAVDERLKNVERFQWIIFGGSVVVGAFIKDIVAYIMHK